MNPKYGSADSSLCSETVSWCYHTYGVRIEGEDFRDIRVHRQLHDAFLAADRLYCYHLGRQAWIRKNSDYDWVLDDEYHPRPGDYLDRRDRPGTNDGHAMMIISWDETTQIAETIDGPWNVNFLPVDVHAMESQSDPFDFCVGRIPFNDLAE